MQNSVSHLLFPPTLRDIPQRRLLLNLLRSWHILSICVLVGGIYFRQDNHLLQYWVWSSIASGGALFAVDLYSSFYALFEIRGASIIIKLILLMLIPLIDHQQQVALLFVIILFSSLVSHSTRRFRHKSLMSTSFQQKYAPDYSLNAKNRR